MRNRIHPRFSTIGLTLALLLVASSPLLGARAKKFANPDFTKGDPIPSGANLDWNLGATGARGWIYANQVSTSDARQIRITKVDKKSPADGVLKVGDVILGVSGKRFSYDPRTEMGKALTVAESNAGGGNLSLLRWRAGTTETVTVKLPVLGDYSATAPYDCPKSKAILEQGCKALARRIVDPSYKANPITRSLNALALLASGNEEYLPVVKKEAQWAAGYSVDRFQTWYYGYVIMLLSEYVIQTGDDSVMPGLRRLALEAANGQSIVGSWGHKFAGPDGRLVGYGMMNAPGLPLTTSLVLARKAGVKEPVVRRAIERSVRLLHFYVDKGCVPYGDHGPWIQTHEDNGKNGMAAVMFNLLGNTHAAEYFSWMSVASHGNERDYGHTGNFCCITWAIPGVAQSGPNATGAWMHEFGAWYFDLARRWDGTYLHQGGESMPRPDAYRGWDCTGAYLLAYAMPLKKLYLTGKGKSSVPPISMAKAQQLLDDGRGWTRKDNNSFYDKLSTEQLFERLSSWSPVVRERAAAALGRRKDDVMSRLIDLLGAPNLYSQYGACQAIKMQKARGSVAVSALLKAYESDDLWLRILIGQALAGIGEPAKPAIPQLLTRLAMPAPKNDPRKMEQRFLSSSLFDKRGLIGNSLKGVDRTLLLKAVRATLQNEDGRARLSVTTVYANLSDEEIKPLLPAILQAVVEPAPSGIMFADGIRLEGLRVLTKHRVKEAIEACVQYAQTQNHWASEKRTPQLMEILLSYGAHAKPMIPKLKKLADRFAKGEGAFPRHLSLRKAEMVRKTIRTIEASNEYPKLIHLKQ